MARPIQYYFFLVPLLGKNLGNKQDGTTQYHSGKSLVVPNFTTEFRKLKFLMYVRETLENSRVFPDLKQDRK